MNRLLLILFYISIFNTDVFAKNVINTAYQKAHELYEQHQYNEAKQIYDSLRLLGISNSDLYYNLGNVYYKLNQIGQAVLHFEKAINLNPNNEDALFNLKIANLKVVTKNNRLNDFIVVRWVKGVIHYFQFDQWAKAQILFGILFLILFSLFNFLSNPSIKKISFYSSITVLCLMLLCGIFAWSAQKDLQTAEYGIVINTPVSLVSEPSTNAKEILILHEGMKFRKMETIGKWYQIKLSDGNIGWVEASSIAMI